jgi:hypothetical protein
MANMKLKDFFEMLTSVMDIKTFKYDTDKQIVSVNVPLHWETIIDFKKTVLSFLGNPHLADRDWDKDPEHWGYKFDSHYIEIDEETIKVNEKGRLYVDPTELTDYQPFLDKILEDDIALQKLADKILSRLVLTIPEQVLNPPNRPCHHDPNHDHEECPDQP